VGVLGRFFSFMLAVDMVVAALLVHLPNGFFMNWYGTQAGEGFEFHLLAVGLAMVVMIGGSGAASVDRALSSRASPAE
jgi:putative oxidoreductase